MVDSEGLNLIFAVFCVRQAQVLSIDHYHYHYHCAREVPTLDNLFKSSKDQIVQSMLFVKNILVWIFILSILTDKLSELMLASSKHYNIKYGIIIFCYVVWMNMW